MTLPFAVAFSNVLSVRLCEGNSFVYSSPSIPHISIVVLLDAFSFIHYPYIAIRAHNQQPAYDRFTLVMTLTSVFSHLNTHTQFLQSTSIVCHSQYPLWFSHVFILFSLSTCRLFHLIVLSPSFNPCFPITTESISSASFVNSVPFRLFLDP